MARKLKFLLLTCTIFLSSCEVHFFDKVWQVEWYVIAIPVMLFDLTVLYLVGKELSKKKFVCPNCHKTFYPKWWIVVFSGHIDNDRLLKCPHCGKKDYCSLSHNQCSK